MRILHLNDFAAGTGGGAEIYLERLADAQQAAGDVVDVYTPAQRRGGLPVADVWNLAARRQVCAHVRSFGPDVVHLHNIARELSPSVLGAGEGAPLVMTVHDLRLAGRYEHSPWSGRGAVERILTSRLLRRQVRRHVSHFIAVSTPVADELRASGFGPVSVVSVPVRPPSGETHLPSRSRVVVFAGRLSRDKGCHVLVDAVRSLAKDGVDLQLVVAGDGPERAALEAQASDVESLVSFRGRLDPGDVSALLGGARVVVVPSIPWLRREGAPLSAAEAARHGRPVIASDDPGLAELTAGVHGIVLPAGDVDALTEELRTMLSDDERVDEIGARAATAAVQRHDTEVIAREVRKVYDEVRAHRGVRSGTWPEST